MAKIDPEDKVRKELLENLIRNSGWKLIDEILESQWLGALAKFKASKTLEDFISAQAVMNQVEGLISQIKGKLYVPQYGANSIKKTMNFLDIPQ